MNSESKHWKCGSGYFLVTALEFTPRPSLLPHCLVTGVKHGAAQTPLYSCASKRKEYFFGLSATDSKVHLIPSQARRACDTWNLWLVHLVHWMSPITLCRETAITVGHDAVLWTGNGSAVGNKAFVNTSIKAVRFGLSGNHWLCLKTSFNCICNKLFSLFISLPCFLALHCGRMPSAG